MSKVVREIELFFQEGSSDKVYNAQIVEEYASSYTVKVQWGRRGSSLQEGTKAVKVSRAVADAKFDSCVREKRNKGYEEKTATTKPAAVAPPAGQGSGSKSGGVQRAVVGLKAQLLNPIDDTDLDAFLANDAMLAQQKIDGMRILAHVNKDGVLATNREGQVSKMATSSLDGLEYLPAGTIVDGELLDDGYWLFDILSFAGTDVRMHGYHTRWKLLDEECEPALSGDIRIVPIASGAKAKRALYNRLFKAGAEGIVFKDAAAPYTAGRPSSGGTQRKHKFVKSADVVITENAGNAYRMAVYNGKKLVECGKVFAGTTNASRAELDLALAAGKRPICEVRYLYATDDHVLFQPVFVRIRDDKTAAQCIRSQLLQTCRTVLV
ncbi:MAG: WGR domain-containing protein [Kofleriaceae bacterium]